MMKIKLIVFIKVIILVSQAAFCEANYAQAQINGIKSNDGQLVIEFSWVNESGFIKKTELTKARLDYQNWQDKLRVSIHKILPWTKPLTELYPKQNFDECVNFLQEKYAAKENVLIGQSGNEPFHPNSSGKEFYVPYAELIKIDGKFVCLFYAGTDGR